MIFSTISLFDKIDNYMSTFTLLSNIGNVYRILIILLSQSYLNFDYIIILGLFWLQSEQLQIKSR